MSDAEKNEAYQLALGKILFPLHKITELLGKLAETSISFLRSLALLTTLGALGFFAYASLSSENLELAKATLAAAFLMYFGTTLGNCAIQRNDIQICCKFPLFFAILLNFMPSEKCNIGWLNPENPHPIVAKIKLILNADQNTNIITQTNLTKNVQNL
jgi:hypothetical protein